MSDLRKTVHDIMESKAINGEENGHAKKSRFTVTATSSTASPKVFPTWEEAAASLNHLGERGDAWTYNNARGQVVASVLRFDKGGAKEFRHLSSRKGGWMVGEPAGKWPLYCLPLEPDRSVFVLANEECVDEVVSEHELGLNATTSATGVDVANSDWSSLCGRTVYILPGKDEASEKYASDVAAILYGLDCQVAIVRLPDLAAKEGVVEFIAWRNEDGKDDIAIGEEISAIAKNTPHYRGGDAPRIERFSIGELQARYPHQHPPVIEGLLRERETANIISYSKIGKSWKLYCLLLCIVTGRLWYGRFATARGRVLLIDNELHRPTLAMRVKTVANAMGIPHSEYADMIEVWPLRGNLRNIFAIESEMRTATGFKLIAFDAKYRMQPAGAAENANECETAFYNQLDRYAEMTGAAIASIHHATKGGQSDKRVTDVGAGGGAQSRAADCHLVLREHEDDGICVLDAAVRSFAPIEPLALRWDFPLWVLAEGVDPTALRGRLNPKEERQSKSDREGIETVTARLKVAPATLTKMLDTEISRDRLKRLVALMVSDGKVTWREVVVNGNLAKEYALALANQDVGGH